MGSSHSVRWATVNIPHRQLNLIENNVEYKFLPVWCKRMASIHVQPGER